MTAADRAIRASTAAAVVAVAGIAAYVSYWHAYDVVRAHGESGVTARLEPFTIDGLVYASSMVVLYAARHRLAVPALARCLLGLGIVATLAANVAHGWPAGPIGAGVAAWPAASLVGSYELLLWLIRTAAAGAVDGEPGSDRAAGPAAQPIAALRLVPAPAPDGPVGQRSADSDAMADDKFQGSAGWVEADGRHTTGADNAAFIDASAVAAYRASIDAGRPLSERKLAAMFGKTSRRWARNRMADARVHLSPAGADGR